jgi:hypothetical protein
VSRREPLLWLLLGNICYRRMQGVALASASDVPIYDATQGTQSSDEVVLHPRELSIRFGLRTPPTEESTHPRLSPKVPTVLQLADINRRRCLCSPHANHKIYNVSEEKLASACYSAHLLSLRSLRTTRTTSSLRPSQSSAPPTWRTS